MSPVRLLVAASALVALGACDLPAPGGVYRDQGVPISASTRYDRAGFAGEWIVSDGFGLAPGAKIVFEPVGETGDVVLSGRGAGALAGRYRAGVPGELIPVSGGSPLVVMWVDETRETAAIGTVSGSAGALIDRDGRVPPDKRLAARAIFDFYGWDVGRLTGAGA